jgi:S-adenosylmethionine:tRNA ribosyltransferase-isomerase
MEDRQPPAYGLAAYDFDLPPELIAQTPAEHREESRLLVLDRPRGAIAHSRFADIAARLRPGDLLVVNDTKVVPARLTGRKETGGRVELLVLDPCKPEGEGGGESHCCLVKTSKRLRAGQMIHLKDGSRAEVAEVLEDGKAAVRFPGPGPLLDLLDRAGEMPLPPYIVRKPGDGAVDDAARYQTEYAKNPGAVAAPTAGLHFSRPLLESLEARGVSIAPITLHVGYGTFSPVRTEDIRDHAIHSEYVEVSRESAERIQKAREESRRIVAVGTTVVRTLEWIASRSGEIVPTTGFCGHYIYPGYRFRAVGAMITNFHLPRSSLILLVSAFAGREAILSAYEEAKRLRYRFFSYGDAMLIV